MSVRSADGIDFDIEVPVVIIGAGACGLTAALAAADRGTSVVVLERDSVPSGSTALSSGMIPACGTPQQHAKGVTDAVGMMMADIQKKADGAADPVVLEAVCRVSGPTIRWLMEQHGLALQLVDEFLYPGHSVPRMHAPPSRTGAELMGMLTNAAEATGIDIVTDAPVADLYTDDQGRVCGVEIERPDGARERLGSGAVILACNGFAGDPDMVAAHIPEMVGAAFSGHAGNKGDAVRWGKALGAAVKHMGAYQGHGSVATPHGVLITWGIMMEGGIQVNAEGHRFSNEHQGYSEQAVFVLNQPGRIAWDVYDGPRHRVGMGFEDYRQADEAGAVRVASDEAALAAMIGCDPDALSATLADVRACALGQAEDRFGRDFTAKAPLAPPYYAVKVTGSLFHTQGGLVIDGSARVLRPDGTPLPNLFAGGGAACGVSGPRVEGYLSGNGLLTAVMLGRVAGEAAAALVA